MSRNNLTQRGLVGMALVLFLGSGFAAATSYWVQKSDYVAIVAGERLNNLAYQHRLLEVRQMLRTASLPDQVIEEMAFNQLIERTLMTQEARRQNLTVSDEALETEWQRVLTNSYSSDTERMNQDLRRSHYSPADFRQELRERLLMQQLQEKFGAQAHVSEAELKSYYQQHQKEFSQPERIEAWHILLKADDTKPAQLKSARGKAEQVLNQLKAGGSFEALAKKYSEDGTSSAKGGKLEAFGKGDMMPSFEAAAWKLKAGEVYPAPVQTTYGWHLIKRGQTLPAGFKSFSAAKADFEPQVLAQQQQKALQQWLDKQRQRVSIIRHPKFIEKPVKAPSGTALPPSKP
jgi:parvulin-like peptidyl-prolyl isomerase